MKFADLHRLQEDDRIREIGEKAAAGNLVGVLVDDQEKKIARYIKKVTERYPTVKLIDRQPGPTRGIVTLRFGPNKTNPKVN